MKRSYKLILQLTSLTLLNLWYAPLGHAAPPSVPGGGPPVQCFPPGFVPKKFVPSSNIPPGVANPTVGAYHGTVSFPGDPKQLHQILLVDRSGNIVGASTHLPDCGTDTLHKLHVFDRPGAQGFVDTYAGNGRVKLGREYFTPRSSAPSPGSYTRLGAGLGIMAVTEVMRDMDQFTEDYLDAWRRTDMNYASSCIDWKQTRAMADAGMIPESMVGPPPPDPFGGMKNRTPQPPSLSTYIGAFPDRIRNAPIVALFRDRERRLEQEREWNKQDRLRKALPPPPKKEEPVECPYYKSVREMLRQQVREAQALEWQRNQQEERYRAEKERLRLYHLRER